MSFVPRLVIAFALLMTSCELDSESESKAKASSVQLTFVGDGFSPHDGQNLKVALLRQSTGEVLLTQETVVQNGAFSLVMDEVPSDEILYLDYFADANENGQCDAPMTDHTWRLRLAGLSEDTTLKDTHSMNFVDVCQSFSETPAPSPSGETVSLLGTLAVGSGVTGEPGLDSGTAVKGATVFLEGFPESEVTSDASGAFTLQIELPEGQSLKNQNHNIVMWFTSPQQGSVIESWPKESLRIGARRPLVIDASAQTQEVGSVDLNYTSRVRFSIKEESSGKGVDHCWISLPKYRFFTFFKNLGDGEFRLDYLPPGNYDLNLRCVGYQEKSVSIEVGEVSSKNQEQVLEGFLVSSE